MPATVDSPFWADLAARGSAPALVSKSSTSGGSSADGTGSTGGPTRLTYAELGARVADLGERLGTNRRLVLLRAANDIDTVVGYLACLAGGHPVLLAQDRQVTALTAAYDPDVVLDTDVTERRAGTRHDLHPDLAALMSTSGTTGSPKLVRLTHRNLASNAAAIAAYLQIRPTDVAATTLPLHYCYGLSVLTSHLAAGASVALTERSVLEPAFWDLVRAERVTTFPGVPHTFELLDRVGFGELDLPSLRYLTSAGGRLDPATVTRFAELGQRRGFDLYVMYGATEATARMAYLPPDLALTRPTSVGVPIPGGSFRIDAPDPSAAGELVYCGDNVMLGYAESPADLARGRDVTELRTGDLARIGPDGLAEIVGRTSRFAKVFGLRVDLDRVEQALLAAGVVGYAADAGDSVVVGVDRTARPVDEDRLREVVEGLGVPAAGFVVRPLDGVPRLPTGKPDYGAMAAAGAVGASRNAPARTVRHAFEEVLGCADLAETDSFVSRGGDSLSYVAMSLRLERALGHLPRDWHSMTVADLERAEQGVGQRLGRGRVTGQPRVDRRWRTVETNVLLRAAAIVMIVGSHSNLFALLGGAHLLVGLAGYNFGRFGVTDRPRSERVSGLTRSILRIVVPSALWLTFAALTTWKYGPLNVVLLNGVFGSREWTESWHYWFIEALVWTLVALTVLLAVPAIDRLERRHPFWLPCALALVALLTRYDVVRLFGGDYIHRAHVIFWLFALGWATVKATGHGHRLIVSALVAATVPGFFPGHQSEREALIVAGLLLLVWLPAVRVPSYLAWLAGVLASASLYIYLCHWQIYPAYEFRLPWLATALSLAAGVVLWQVVVRLTPRAESGAGWVIQEIGDTCRRLSLRRYPTRDEDRERAALPEGAPG